VFADRVTLADTVVFLTGEALAFGLFLFLLGDFFARFASTFDILLRFIRDFGAEIKSVSDYLIQ
jgi:hypothetical protein